MLLQIAAAQNTGFWRKVYKPWHTSMATSERMVIVLLMWLRLFPS